MRIRAPGELRDARPPLVVLTTTFGASYTVTKPQTTISSFPNPQRHAKLVSANEELCFLDQLGGKVPSASICKSVETGVAAERL
jgi:hypothetical protein